MADRRDVVALHLLRPRAAFPDRHGVGRDELFAGDREKQHATRRSLSDEREREPRLREALLRIRDGLLQIGRNFRPKSLRMRNELREQMCRTAHCGEGVRVSHDCHGTNFAARAR